jgi:hypothetical protein
MQLPQLERGLCNPNRLMNYNQALFSALIHYATIRCQETLRFLKGRYHVFT